MAVIIPMAKMPNNCEECDLKGLCPDYWTKTREEYTRPSWCQLDDLDATTFCGVPMEEVVEIMQMYRRGELVHLVGRKTEPATEDCSTVEPQISPSDCKTCKHNPWSTPRTCGKCIRQEDGRPSMYEPEDEPQKKCHRDEEYACHLYPNESVCNNCKLWYENEPQKETTNGLQLFADILFDKDKANQFLNECKTMEIEP